MAVSVDLYGSTLSIPQEGESGWAADTTQAISQAAQGANETSVMNSSLVVPAGTITTLAVTAAGSIPASGAPTKEIYLVSGSGGAVTCGSVAIQNGYADSTIAQHIKIIGTSDTNTVTINNNCNTDQNGSITLGDGDAIEYIWDNSNSIWRETGRTS